MEWTAVLLEDGERRANRSDREMIDGVDGSTNDGSTRTGKPIGGCSAEIHVSAPVEGPTLTVEELMRVEIDDNFNDAKEEDGVVDGGVMELMLVVGVKVLLVILLVEELVTVLIVLLMVLLMVLLDMSPAAEDTAEKETDAECVTSRAIFSKERTGLRATAVEHTPKMELLSVVLVLMVVVFVLEAVGEGDGLVVMVEVLSGDGRAETVLEFGVGTAVRRIPRDTTVVQLVGTDGCC
jgi:hypothetical protein